MFLISAIIVNELSKQFVSSKRREEYKRKDDSQHKNGVVEAVKNISFEVREGEIFGFLGPNGAGKTTTIRMLTGVLEPTKGYAEIFGKNIWKYPIQVKQMIGNVPEMANVFPDLTGMQNLNLIGKLYDIPKNVRLQRAEELLKKFGLYEKRNLKTKTYSKGMIQIVSLGMALISNPKILFLDEPTSGLDVMSARVIKKVIREYNKKGVTIFLTTHNMEVANELCDRIAIINKGRLISLDTPENLKEAYKEPQAINVTFNLDIEKGDLEKLNSVEKLSKTKNGWTLEVPEVNSALIELIDFARSNNLKINQINTLQSSLEDIFLKIIETGVDN